MDTSNRLLELVKKYKEVKDLRMRLDAESKKMKEGLEANLQAQILQLMLESGMQSVHYPGVGRVVSTFKTHYEISDPEKFASAIFQSLSKAAEEGKPLAEALLTQRRVSRESLEGYLEYTGVGLDSCGVAEVNKPELSIRKG